MLRRLRAVRALLHDVRAQLTLSYLRTLAASALIRDDAGRVLLVETGYRRPSWGLPGGRIERGETVTEGVAREVQEETGLRVEVGPLLLVHARPASVVLVFAARVAGGRLAPGAEVHAAEWVDPHALDARPVTNPARLRAALEPGGRAAYLSEEAR